MSMVIQHNIPALQTYNIVNNTSNALQKSIAKLSSGLRINSAADDAAGLAISEKMRAQVKGLDRAVANTQDGISLIQTAEGALQETHSILQRMRELAVQGANDTLTQQDRSYIQEEMDQLKEEITRIGNTTQFNKKKLLNGDSAGLWSSSDMETKAIINGGLREVDQFGQKKSIEGNYKIRVKADPGQAEVQKSDIMTIKHANVLTNKTINSPDGVKDVQVDNMAPGSYSLKLSKADQAAPDEVNITGAYGVGGKQYTQLEAGGQVTAITAPATAGQSVTRTYTFKLGDTVLGKVDLEVKDTTNGGANMAAAAVATAIQDKAGTIIGKAREMGVEISGLSAGLGSAAVTTATGGTAANSITMKRFGSSNVGKLSIVEEGSDIASPKELINFHDAAATGSKSADTEAVVNASDVFTFDIDNDNVLNGSVLFEVTGTDDLNGTLTLKATATLMDQKGVNSTATQDNIVLTQGGSEVSLKDIFGQEPQGTDPETYQPHATIKLNADMYTAVAKNGKLVAYFTPDKSEAGANKGINVELNGDIDTEWNDTWDNGVFRGQTVKYHLDGEALTNTEINFKNYILNEKTGTVSEGTVTLVTDDTFSTSDNKALASTANGGNNAVADGHTLASFTNTYIGKTANGDVRLRDLDKFWNSEGVMMLDDAKKLTLNQGDGKTTSIMLYANDTLDEVATKINDAIATGLGQSKYVDDATKFATFVSNKTELTSEAVPGTFVIRSVVPGAQGEITFSGDQGIIDAFSLNTIQNSKETVYNVDVLDEHSGKIIAQGVKTTGNVMHGVINENVDVEFGALTGIEAKWNGTLNKYTYTAEQQETTLHLADNTTVLQIGANEGEDLGMNIGDMRSHALGIDGVNVMSHDRAGRAITLIDNAIDKVSTQRANLGAYQNRLEYTASNLTTASENLTSAESRIRDTDMAKEMMNFTKLNIMLQAGNSMLAQANQQPQNVLSLIR